MEPVLNQALRMKVIAHTAPYKVLLVLFIMLASVTALGQPNEPVFEEPPKEPIAEPVEVEGKPAGSSSISTGSQLAFPRATQTPGTLRLGTTLFYPEVLSDPLAPLRRKWFQRQRILEVQDFEAARLILISMEQLRIDLGIENLQAYSLGLIRESEIAKQQRKFDRVLFLAEHAAILSPYFPTPQFYLAKVRFQQNPLQISQYAIPLTKGIILSFTRLEYFLPTVGNVILIGSFAFLFSIILYFILLAFKYTPLLSHLLHHILIIKLPDMLSRVLTLALLILPIFLQVGLGWVLFFWIFLFLPVVKWSERIFLIVSVILLLSLPAALPVLGGLLTASSESSYFLVNANQNESSPQEVQKLESLEKTSDPKGQFAFALGLLAKKRGDYRNAETYFRTSLEKKFLPSASQNNLGNVIFARGAPEEALEFYRLAPGSFYKSYNMYQAYYEINDVQRGTNAISDAKNYSDRLYRQFDEIKPKDKTPSIARYNRLLADQPIPTWLLFQNFLEKSEIKSDLLQSWWNFFFYPLEIRKWPFLILIGGIFFLIATISVKFIQFPSRCSKCASPACQWCYATAKRPDLCSQCFNVYVRRESVDPAARESKDIEVAQFISNQSKFVRFLSFIFPGTGHFYLGYTVKGLFITLTFFFALGLFLFEHKVFVSQSGLIQPGAFLFSSLWVLILILLYTFTQKGILQE